MTELQTLLHDLWSFATNMKLLLYTYIACEQAAVVGVDTALPAQVGRYSVRTNPTSCFGSRLVIKHGKLVTDRASGGYAILT